MKEPAHFFDAKSPPSTSTLPTHRGDDSRILDFLIIGSGISGINTAYRIQTQIPSDNYLILEGRSELGGTWSFFKYPGLRSDSDLFTFGFAWRPWKSENPIAVADSILEYLTESATTFGIDKKIRFNHMVKSADWSSSQQLWNMKVNVDGDQTKLIRARYVIWATGYYDYNNYLDSPIPGIANFQGETIHPQTWKEGYDYTGKEMVVIGSGATAITLLPALVDKAKHVTMLQRSPSYILSLPNKVRSSQSQLLEYVLSPGTISQFRRWIFIGAAYFLYYFCRLLPTLAKSALRYQSKYHLSDAAPLSPHFEPTYNPWDQRLCLCPNADFFKALKTDKANIVTGKIKQVNEKSISLEDGSEIKADVIITATGLKILIGGGIDMTIDGKTLKPTDKCLWRGMMLQDVPNACFIIGYTNASWTLGADATVQTFTRLYRIASSKKAGSITPRLSSQDASTMNFVTPLSLQSTYVQKALDQIPKSGDVGPWKPKWNYIVDMYAAKWANLEEGIEFVDADVISEKV